MKDLRTCDSWINIRRVFLSFRAWTSLLCNSLFALFSADTIAFWALIKTDSAASLRFFLLFAKAVLVRIEPLFWRLLRASSLRLYVITWLAWAWLIFILWRLFCIKKAFVCLCMTVYCTREGDVKASWILGLISCSAVTYLWYELGGGGSWGSWYFSRVGLGFFLLFIFELYSRSSKLFPFILFFLYSCSFLLTAVKLTGQIPAFWKECLIVRTVKVLAWICGRSWRKDWTLYLASYDRIAFMIVDCWYFFYCLKQLILAGWIRWVWWDGNLTIQIRFILALRMKLSVSWHVAPFNKRILQGFCGLHLLCWIKWSSYCMQIPLFV
jgi:hypothetical protein